LRAAGAASGGGAQVFPFEVALGFAVARLRLSPSAFWALSPREFSACLRAVQGEAGFFAPPARADLEALMARFPDQSLSCNPCLEIS
jgi:uncharacterized phage protein (TIGR02216 family)